MKNTSIVNTKEYECPSLRFCTIDVCGFICASKIYAEEDNWVSMFGDNPNDSSSGDLIFE